ncbi:MAG: DMT family transporter [Hyphomicrobiales bacterium]|nr:DMT family transporter [Hyphomicrobiales bacterium]
MAFSSRLVARFWHSPRLILGLATLMWAGNGVAGRAIAGQMSPMLVVTGRWLMVFAILAVMLRHRWREVAAVWRTHPWRVALMGSIGFTGFNVLFYAAAYYTSAVNMNLLQTAIPIFVVIGSVAFMGGSITIVQALGVLLTVFATILVTTAGHPENIVSMHFNTGDLMLLLACTFYAGYTLALRGRPRVDDLIFFTALAMAAMVSSLPFLALEGWRGEIVWPHAEGLAILGYITIFPSLVSQLLYLRGVDLIGANRAGVYSNLVPIFGALLALVLLREPFHIYHIEAVVLCLVGIGLTERGKIRMPAPREAVSL